MTMAPPEGERTVFFADDPDEDTIEMVLSPDDMRLLSRAAEEQQREARVAESTALASSPPDQVGAPGSPPTAAQVTAPPAPSTHAAALNSHAQSAPTASAAQVSAPSVPSTQAATTDSNSQPARPASAAQISAASVPPTHAATTDSNSQPAPPLATVKVSAQLTDSAAPTGISQTAYRPAAAQVRAPSAHSIDSATPSSSARPASRLTAAQVGTPSTSAGLSLPASQLSAAQVRAPSAPATNPTAQARTTPAAPARPPEQSAELTGPAGKVIPRTLPSDSGSPTFPPTVAAQNSAPRLRPNMPDGSAQALDLATLTKGALAGAIGALLIVLAISLWHSSPSTTNAEPTLAPSATQSQAQQAPQSQAPQTQAARTQTPQTQAQPTAANAAPTPTEAAQQPAASSETPLHPLRLRNPFDKSETFEFPPGTTTAEARQSVAELLLQRARDRRSQPVGVQRSRANRTPRGRATKSTDVAQNIAQGR